MSRRDLRNAEREWRATRPQRRFHVKRAPRRSKLDRFTDAAISAMFRMFRMLNRI